MFSKPAHNSKHQQQNAAAIRATIVLATVLFAMTSAVLQSQTPSIR